MLCAGLARFNLTSRSRVVCDLFGDVERGIFAAHVVGAHFAFRDDAGNGGFKTPSHLGFLKPSERGIYRKRLTIDEWLLKDLLSIR